MRLPKDLRQRLAREFRFAVDKMHNEDDLGRKLYFFSGMYGETLRVLNFAYDRDLILTHNILQTTYQQFSSRLQAMSARDQIVLLTPTIMSKLAQAADDLATLMEREVEGEALYDILGRLAELGYATTGNGNYLVERGKLKI